MNKIVYQHEICVECGKCHCLDCAMKEADIEPETESFKRFLRELTS